MKEIATPCSTSSNTFTNVFGIIKGDEVNSILTAALRSLTKDELCHLRDKLISRTPKTKEFELALELLRDLADIQNGAPLPTYEKQWNDIMEKVYMFLNKYEK